MCGYFFIYKLRFFLFFRIKKIAISSFNNVTRTSNVEIIEALAHVAATKILDYSKKEKIQDNLQHEKMMKEMAEVNKSLEENKKKRLELKQKKDREREEAKKIREENKKIKEEEKEAVKKKKELEREAARKKKESEKEAARKKKEKEREES